MKTTNREYKTLEEVTPDFITQGIFTALNSLSVPWHDTVDPILLNLEYYTNVSGLKLISPLTKSRLVDGVLNPVYTAQLANIAVAIHGTNWAKQYATLEAEYNPIENYSMIEQLSDDTTIDEFGKTVTRTNNLNHTKTGTDTRTDNLSDARTVNLEHEKTGTDTRTDNLSDARTVNLEHEKTGTDTRTDNLSDARTVNLEHEKTGTDTRTDNLSDAKTLNLSHGKTGTDTRTDNLSDARTANLTHGKTGTETKAPGVTITTESTFYGFNSSTAVPSEGGSQVSSGQELTTYNLQETDTGTDTTLHTGTSAQGYNTTETDTGTVTDREGGSNTKTREYTLTRSGNIGVTTSQQMLQSERDLWLWNFFRDIVFPDLDYILTIPTY